MKIRWVTNLAAPYRRPLWEAIGETNDLEVQLLENDEQFVSHPGNRGLEWTAVVPTNYRIVNLPTIAIRFGEGSYYIKRTEKRRVEQGDPDPDILVLGGWESPAYWQVNLKARAKNIPRVGFYESTLMSQGHPTGPISHARSWFLRSLDAVVVPGPAAGDAVLAAGVESSRIFTGFNSVDVAWIANSIDRASESERQDTGHRYLYVGQLITRKNIESLLEAFRRIADVDDTLTIAGSGELRLHLEKLAAGLRVRFTGPIPYAAIPEVLSQHDTLVLPSSEEVWGLVVNEALAGGLHAVVSTNAGVTQSVERMNGVFAVAPTIEGIAEGMTRSRTTWTGPIEHADILDRTPAEFASVFVRAMNSAVERSAP